MLIPHVSCFHVMCQLTCMSATFCSFLLHFPHVFLVILSCHRYATLLTHNHKELLIAISFDIYYHNITSIYMIKLMYENKIAEDNFHVHLNEHFTLLYRSQLGTFQSNCVLHGY